MFLLCQPTYVAFRIQRAELQKALASTVVLNLETAIPYLVN